MKTIAFIFARAGSKGLPGKNSKILNGKPLIQYSIDTAKKVSHINEIFVSTDCKSIAAIAKKNNVKVIKRPARLASDNSPEWLSWKHAIDHVNKNFGTFDRFISMPTTSPLRSVQDVYSALDKLDTTNADICISVTPASRNPYFNMVQQNGKNNFELVIEPNNIISRRQDSPKVYDITTVVYAAKVSFIQQHNSIFSGKLAAIVVPKSRSLDIDDIYDFLFAETLLKSDLYD